MEEQPQVSDPLRAVNPKLSVDSLFRIKIKTEVLGRSFWIRVLSETDTQARDEYAMYAMAARRKALLNPQSREYETFVAGLVDEADDTLKQAVLMVEMQGYARQAQADIAPALIPFPENATDEEKAQTIEARQTEYERVRDARAELIEKKVADRRTELDKLSHAELVALTRQKQIEAQGRQAMTRAFINYTLYAALFTDEACKHRAFEKPEQVSDLPSDVRDQLTDTYFKELDTVTPQDLQYFFSTGGSRDSAKTSTPSAATPESLEANRPAK